MKTEISAVRKILRACKVRGAHHQIATRRLRDAATFADKNTAHAAVMLAEAFYHATIAAEQAGA